MDRTGVESLSPVDPSWDELPADQRREELVALASVQFEHLVENVEYFRREPLYRRIEIESFADLDPSGEVPIQTDEQVSRADEETLIPDGARWFENFGTGGTSGEYKNVLDSRASWTTSIRRMAHTVERMEERAPGWFNGIENRTAYNTYNGNHVTATILNRAACEAGARAYRRKLDQGPREMLAEMADLGVDMLIAPGRNPHSEKGGSIENLLAVDGEDGYIANEIERVWYSSTPLSESDRALLEATGTTIESWYGNTEARAFGYAPPHHPDHPHLLDGQYLVVGFDDREMALRWSGEDLMLLTSAIAEHRPDGVGPHTGTAFFNYQTGVRADIGPPGGCPYHDDCPLTTRTLDMDSHRRLPKMRNVVHGCEVEVGGGSDG